MQWYEIAVPMHRLKTFRATCKQRNTEMQCDLSQQAPYACWVFGAKRLNADWQQPNRLSHSQKNPALFALPSLPSQLR